MPRTFDVLFSSLGVGLTAAAAALLLADDNGGPDMVGNVNMPLVGVTTGVPCLDDADVEPFVVLTGVDVVGPPILCCDTLVVGVVGDATLVLVMMGVGG